MIPLPPALAGQIGSSGFKVVMFLLAMIASAAGGAYLMADHKDAVIARMEADKAKDEAAVVAAGAKRLRAALALGDALFNQLADAEKDRQKTALEHQREIKRLTTGRPCLSADVVGLLNGTGQGNSAAGLSAPADGAAAEDGPFATDTDVAGWADNARRQYETCRDRLGALIDFNTGEK